MADYPHLPFFTDAYLGDTMHLSLEEHGAYLKLLMIAWRSPGCDLPDDDRRLATMLGISTKRWVEALRPTIAPFWTIEDGRWRQKKLSEVRKHVESVSEKRKEARAARGPAKSLNGHGTPPTNVPTKAPTNEPYTRARNPNPNPKPESKDPIAAAESLTPREAAAADPVLPMVDQLFARVGAMGVARGQIEREVRAWVDALGAPQTAALLAKALREARQNPMTLAAMMVGRRTVEIEAAKHAAERPPPEREDPWFAAIRANRARDLEALDADLTTAH